MLTASVVTYHTSLPEAGAVLDCVLRSSIDKLYIIDNSRNDALRILEKRSSKIRYIHNANIGYGGAHNLAIREAMELGAKYHVVLNPDIRFAPETIESLACYMDAHEDVGQIMPKVFYPDGRLQYLCKLLPTPADLIFRRFLPTGWAKKSRERFELRFSDYDKEKNIPFLSGCFMFLRVEALCKVGLFDERFFMYGEDIDLSRRMHLQYRTMYYPGASIVHLHEAASYKNRRMLLIHIRNIIRYFNKWGLLFDAQRRKINRRLLKDLNYNR